MHSTDNRDHQFLSRWGFWYLTGEELRVESGPLNFLHQLHRESRSILVALIAVTVFTCGSLVLTWPPFFRTVGLVIVGAVFLGGALVGLPRVLARYGDLTYTSTIRVADIEGIGIAETANGVVLIVVAESGGDSLVRPIALPMRWYCDVATEIERVKAACGLYGIPVEQFDK